MENFNLINSDEVLLEQKKELLIKKFTEIDFFETNDMLHIFDKKISKDWNSIYRFFKYKEDETVYKGVDVDVSLGNIVMYQMLNPNLKKGIIVPQKESYNKYEIVCKENTYRGDTMTSLWTVMRFYLTEMWFSNDSSKQFKEIFERRYNNLCIPKNREDEYKNFQSYVEQNMAKDNEFFTIVFNEIVKSEKLTEFASSYFLAGNYIEVPLEFNTNRSNSGKWDTVDRLLWKIFQYYTTGSDVLLESLFSNLGVNTIANTKAWLQKNKSWNLFIENHCLQDFVVNLGNGEYGKPYSLITGKEIACNNDVLKYEPIPKDLKELESFCINNSNMIKARTKRMGYKLQNQGE